MIRRIHAAAGVVGFLVILTFWCATVGSELLGSPETVTAVKRAILWGMLVLVPSMAAAGATGFQLLKGKSGPLALAKKRRMLIIAPNGLLVLIPCAVYLYSLAASGRFDGTFRGVQALELAAGLVNLSLMGLNIRDGLCLARRNGEAGGHAASKSRGSITRPAAPPARSSR